MSTTIDVISHKSKALNYSFVRQIPILKNFEKQHLTFGMKNDKMIAF